MTHFPAAYIDADARAPTSPRGTYTLFFYGTLVHPAILSKIIGHAGSTLSIQPAILPRHELHHVVGQDYPALLTLERSESVAAEGKHLGAVRGTVVRGLGPEDVRRLDAFEGDEYVRVRVRIVPDPESPALANDVRPRDALAGVLAQLDPARVKALLARGDDGEEEAQAYLWRAPLDLLEARVWDFAEFANSGRTARWV